MSHPRRFGQLVFLLLWSLLLPKVVSAEPAPAPGQPVNPALTSAYRGATDKLLARTPWATLSEADLYLFLLMTNFDTPLLYEEYGKATPGPDAAALRTRVEKAVGEWAVIQALAAESGVALDDPLDHVRLRVIELPIHELLWIDHYLAPQVKVATEDVKKYINDHPASATLASRACVRYIFLRVPPDAPTATQRDAETKMDGIRDRIVKGEMTFEEAARRYSEAPSAAQGGLVPEFKERTYFSTFEENAFALEPGKVSPVFLGPTGVYLVQGVSRKPVEPLPFEQVEPAVRDLLYFTQLQCRYSYGLWDLRKKTPVTNRAALVDTLDPDALALKVGEFELTREQVWSLFPDFVTTDFLVDKAALFGDTNRVATLELIAQFNEQNNLTDYPALTTARQMARCLLKSEKSMRGVTESVLRLTPAEIHEYVQSHKNAFQGVMAPRFSMVQVRLVNPKGMAKSRREWELSRMRRVAEQARDACSSTTLIELATTWPDRNTLPTSLVPITIERTLTQAADDSVEVLRWECTQPDTALSKKTQAMIADVRSRLLKLVASGERFLPVIEDDKSLTLFYVEQPDFSSPAITNLAQSRIYRDAARNAVTETVDRMRGELVAQGKLKLLIP